MSDAWPEVWQEAHAKAFTVARATRLDVLTDLHAEVLKIGTEGITEAEFMKALTPRLKAKGWWGLEERVDPKTGELTEVMLGSPHRLKTIYRTNAATAYSAGRYRAFDENREARPFWQYVSVMDARTRPAHAALDGKVFALDDPATGIFWPPNDWGCRCRPRALSAEDLARQGLVPEETAGKIGWENVPAEKDGEPRPRATYRTTDAYGDPVTFRAGAGWSHNPGQAWAKPFTPPPLDTLPRTFPPGRDLPPLPKPTPVSRERLLPDGLPEAEYYRRFRAAFPAEAQRTGVFRDVTGEAVPIGEELFRDARGRWKIRKNDRHQYLEVLAETIARPDEIWLAWEQRGEQWSLRRRYLKAYAIEGQQIPGLSVFELGKDGWSEVTLFQVTDDQVAKTGLTVEQYVNRQRGTFLHYRRNESG